MLSERVIFHSLAVIKDIFLHRGHSDSDIRRIQGYVMLLANRKTFERCIVTLDVLRAWWVCSHLHITLSDFRMRSDMESFGRRTVRLLEDISLSKVARFEFWKMLGKTSHLNVATCLIFGGCACGLKSFAGSMVRGGLRLLARSKV